MKPNVPESNTLSKQANKARLKEMLSTPTNNFGLAQLFKNFALIAPEYQIEEVSP